MTKAIIFHLKILAKRLPKTLIRNLNDLFLVIIIVIQTLLVNKNYYTFISYIFFD